jgi:hypothetical protein
MRKFKIFDFWMNVVLIVVGFIIISFFCSRNNSDNKIIILFPCFFWGVWQVISMIVHLFDKKNWKYSVIRFSYTILSVLVLIYSFSIRLDDYNHTYLLPVMAIFYTCLCGAEVYNKIDQPLD